ncbi:MAG: metallophosphoesterase [Phycisphaerales bacterium]
MTDAAEVTRVLLEGAAASRSAACRQGSIDVVHAPGRLIATGDLHDNPMHMATVVEAANLASTEEEAGKPRSHLVLHELIHGDNRLNGMDLSYRVLTRAADLKRRFPEHVHVLLANHELSQISGAGIVKDGVRVVEAFNAGVEYVFGSETDMVQAAIGEFVRSMPLALRCVTPKGDILCAHSLPTAAIMSRFDPTVLSRALTEEDYQPRTGSAYIMVWGRKYDTELLEDLAERWGVGMFVLGHEHCPDGVMLVPPAAVVLNSDHERGVYLPIDLEHPPRPEACAGMCVALRGA